MGYLSIDKLDLEIKQSIGTLAEKRAVSLDLMRINITLLGCCDFTYFEATSFLTCNTSLIKCICNGSFTDIFGCNSSIFLGYHNISDSSSFLWGSDTLGSLHRTPLALDC